MRSRQDYAQMVSFFTKITLSFVNSRLDIIETSYWQSNRPIELVFTTYPVKLTSTQIIFRWTSFHLCTQLELFTTSQSSKQIFLTQIIWLLLKNVTNTLWTVQFLCIGFISILTTFVKLTISTNRFQFINLSVFLFIKISLSSQTVIYNPSLFLIKRRKCLLCFLSIRDLIFCVIRIFFEAHRPSLITRKVVNFYGW